MIGDSENYGGRFTITLFNIEQPGDARIALEAFGPDFDGLNYDQGYCYADLICPAVTDSAGTVVTHRCETFCSATVTPGNYEYSVYLFAAEAYLTTVNSPAVMAPFEVNEWWNTFTHTASVDYFQGYIQLAVEFSAVPDDVSGVELVAWQDTDANGLPDRAVQTLPCSPGAPGMWTCQASDPGLAPLCVQTNSGQECSSDTSQYFFKANDRLINLTIGAVHFQPTRYDEGRYFGNESYDTGGLLQDSLNLDTFTLGNSDSCLYQDDEFCYDHGFYTAWMIEGWTGSIRLGTAGITFSAVSDASGVTVDAAVPRLPVGAHGVKVQVAWQLGGGGGWNVADLDCGAASCTPLVLADLPPGVYTFELRVFNNHPQVLVYDYYGGELEWGQEIFGVVTHDPVTVP